MVRADARVEVGLEEAGLAERRFWVPDLNSIFVLDVQDETRQGLDTFWRGKA